MCRFFFFFFFFFLGVVAKLTYPTEKSGLCDGATNKIAESNVDALQVALTGQ